MKATVPAKEILNKNPVSDESVSAVIHFYERDDVSRQAPGRKDATNVRLADGTKTKVQTRHLTSSIKETFSMFCDEEPDVQIGKSKFAELRPKQVQLSNNLPHNVCQCKYHENFIAAIESLHKAIPEFPAYSQTLPLTFLCEGVTDACWKDECAVCSGGQGFIAKYGETAQEENGATWYVWRNDESNKLCKVLEERTTDDLQRHHFHSAPVLPTLLHIKREQSTAYQQEREAAVSDTHDPSHALIQVDFPENYTCIAQDEIKSAHWKQHQVSLFTVAIWHSGSIHSHVIASDNITHSKETVIAYINKILDLLPANVKTVSFWSDGPSSQFKNRYHIASLAGLQQDHNVEITWNYFAASHGKGPVDGIGGSAKRHVWNKVRSRKHHVDSARTFVLAAQDMPRVQVVEMTSTEIDKRNEDMGFRDQNLQRSSCHPKR